jgi:hypothetical protein
MRLNSNVPKLWPVCESSIRNLSTKPYSVRDIWQEAGNNCRQLSLCWDFLSAEKEKHFLEQQATAFIRILWSTWRAMFWKPTKWSNWNTVKQTTKRTSYQVPTPTCFVSRCYYQKVYQQQWFVGPTHNSGSESLLLNSLMIAPRCRNM